MLKWCLAAVTFALAQPSFGQYHVMPPAYANTPGTSTFLSPFTTGPRTYQMLIHESLLNDLVGQQLNGLTWRLPTSATAAWPGSDATFANYDIYLGQSVAPADRSLVFAENRVGPQTQVRGGSLTVNAGAFPSGGSPNQFGQVIGFTPWTYTGGHLLVEIRHTGNPVGSRSVDALSTSTAGYGTLFSGVWQSSYEPTTGMQANFTVVAFTTVPAPAGLAFMALAMLGVGRRRRS